MQARRGVKRTADFRLSTNIRPRLQRYPLKRRKTENLDILKLPNEILEKIFVNLNKANKKHFEMTCHRFKEVSGDYYKHEVDKARFELNRKQTNHTILIDIINLVGEFHSNFGLAAFFHKMLHNLFETLKRKRNGSLTIAHMIQFLNTYFKFVERCQVSQNHSKIMFILTTIHLLRHFSSLHVTIKRLNKQNLSIHITVNGIWYAVVYSTRVSASLEFPSDRETFLKMLCILLINDRKLKTYYKIWDCDEKVIALGNNYKHNPRRKKFKPVTSFGFNITANEKVAEYFEKFLNGSGSVIDSIPKESFSVMMRISCTESRKWGANKISKMYFSGSSVIWGKKIKWYFQEEIWVTVFYTVFQPEND